MKKSPLISIILSNYNGAKLKTLQECLIGFKKIDYPNFEFLLVDNASTDNSREVAKWIFSDDKRFRIIENAVNMYSQGVNLAYSESRGEYIALFNNDIKLGSRYLQRLMEAFGKYPRLAVAQGKLLWSVDSSIIDSAGESMDIYGNPVTIGYKSKDLGQFDKDEVILSATGAACLIKRSSLFGIGVYDPEYGIGYEDMDHCLRLRLNGFEIMRINSAVCYHKRAVTDSSPAVKVKVRWHFNKNRLTTMIRNYPLSTLLEALPVTLLIYLLNFGWDVLVNRNLSLAMTRLSAISWVIKNLPRLVVARWQIRQSVKAKDDRKTLSLFAKSDLAGKVKAVILDKFRFQQLKYQLPWTYPAQIKRLIPVGSTVLDIGCGDGHLMNWINSQGVYKVVGVDINQQDLSIASTRRTLAGDKLIFQKLIIADITKPLNLKTKFDVVLCSQTVEHLKKTDALELIKRVERYAIGRMIVATINGYFQFNHRKAGKYDLHLSGWTPQEFKQLGYRVYGHGLRVVYKPGMLRDHTPRFLHPLLFILSYLTTPLVTVFYPAALLQIAYKEIKK